MSKFHIERVMALPDPLTASTMYIVKKEGTALAEVHFSNNEGTSTQHVVNSADITDMISTALASFNVVYTVNTILERNALVLPRNSIVLVADARGDNTVRTGGALYVYNKSANSYIKVSEFESMGVVLDWSNIQNKPVSTIAEIDDAVSKRHSHINSGQLSKIGEDSGGNLTYNNSLIKAGVSTSDW